MNSIREHILEAIVAALEPVATAAGAVLARSPPTGITQEQSPALLVFPESDAITQRPNDRVERHLIVRIVAVARATDTERPEVIADRLLVAAHLALFQTENFGGLVLGLHEIECEWDVEDADATAAAIPARYQITYRTLVSDISQKG